MEHQQTDQHNEQLYNQVDSDNFSSLQASQYQTCPITFPQGPSSFPLLYQIYKKNCQKMTQLTSLVQSTQKHIIQLQRIRQNSTQIHFQEIQIIQQIVQESPFMVKYFQQCKQRQKELDGLARTYNKIKMLTIQASLLQNQKGKMQLMEYIQGNRSVKSVNLSGNWMVLVVRQKVRKDKGQRLKVLGTRGSKGSDHSGRSGSRGKRQHRQGSQQDRDMEEIRSIRVVNIQNILYCLKQKSATTLQPQQLTPQLLQKTKENASKFNYSTIYRLTAKLSLLQATYDQSTGSLFGYVQDGTIYKLTPSGSIQSKVVVESALSDSVQLFQARKGQLCVCTASGIVRLFNIQRQKFQLTDIYGCCLQNFQKVKNFYLQGESPLSNILFTMNNIVYSLDLSTSQITILVQLQGNPVKIINNYILSSTNLRSFGYDLEGKKVQLGVSVGLPQQLEQFMASEQQIVFLGRVQNGWDVVTSDSLGNIKYTSLQ